MGKMRRYFSFQNCLSLLTLVVICFFTSKLINFETKIDQLARPAKLFSVGSIQSTFAPNPLYDVKNSPELDTFFYVVSQQQFNWLGRGAQALAFESQDGRYVLKLFQLARLRSADEALPFWKRWFSKDAEAKQKERLEHREEIFSSSKQCFEELQDETGIVYVHLNRTDNKIKGIKLVDRFGQSHRIRGDDACFVVQKKAQYLIPTITQLMDAGQVDQAKARVSQLLDLLFVMAKKGFVDNDDALIRNNNIGFTKDRAVYIDTGHLVKDQTLDIANRMRYEFRVRLDPFEKWLDWTYPEVASYFRLCKTQILTECVSQKKQVEDFHQN